MTTNTTLRLIYDVTATTNSMRADDMRRRLATTTTHSTAPRNMIATGATTTKNSTTVIRLRRVHMRIESAVNPFTTIETISVCTNSGLRYV